MLIVTTTSFTHGLLDRPLKIMSLLKASVRDPSLVGRDGASARFAMIQWCIIFWRLLALLEIVILMAACPGCFFPTERALLLLALGLAHTLVFAWLRARTPVTETRTYYFFDLLACLLLMLIGGNAILIFTMSLYSTTALLARPMVRFWQALLPATALCLTFIAAVWLAPPSHYSDADVADYAVLFFFWAGAWVMGSRIIQRAAVLELDAHLEGQRRRFRRQLHDDLGNTLCGLHYKVQTLDRTVGDGKKKALGFLVQGYDRASRVLDQLLEGIDLQADCETLPDFYHKLERDFDISLDLNGDTGEPELSPQVKHEVFSIIREAVANAVKHGSRAVTIRVLRRRGNLEISVSDQGPGFDDRTLIEKQVRGSLGIKGMKERAEAIGGQLDIESIPGTGTVVRLSIRENTGLKASSNRLTSRLLDSDTYLLLVKLKTLVLILVLVQVVLLEPSMRTNPAVLLVVGLVTAENLSWYAFRSRLYAVLTHHPWLLILDALFYSLLYYVSWRAGVPLLVSEPVSMFIVISAYFLGVTRNLALSLILAAGILAASLLAPPDATLELQRYSKVITDIMDNIILAVLAGFTFLFIRNLDELRAGAVEDVLERQRVSFSASTHRDLSALIHSLKEKVSQWEKQSASRNASMELSAATIQSRSTELKTRLREILRSLEEQDGRGAARQVE